MWCCHLAICPIFAVLLTRKLLVQLHFAANCPLSLKQGFEARGSSQRDSRKEAVRGTLETWCEEVSKARKARLKEEDFLT